MIPAADSGRILKAKAHNRLTGATWLAIAAAGVELPPLPIDDNILCHSWNHQ